MKNFKSEELKKFKSFGFLILVCYSFFNLRLLLRNEFFPKQNKTLLGALKNSQANRN